jgi:hypothetical protein
MLRLQVARSVLVSLHARPRRVENHNDVNDRCDVP